MNAAYGDFELRAKDQVVLVYQGAQLRLIYNLTIGVQYVINAPDEGKAWLIAIVVVAAILLIWAISAIYR